MLLVFKLWILLFWVTKCSFELELSFSVKKENICQFLQIVVFSSDLSVGFVTVSEKVQFLFGTYPNAVCITAMKQFLLKN